MATMEDLARSILNNQTTNQTVADLAACLHHGNGAMRLGDTNRGLLVLGNIANVMDPSEPGFRPTLVSFVVAAVPPPGSVGSAKMVGNHWRQIGDKTGLANQRPEGNYKPWAPAATRSLARVPFGGAAGRVRAITPDIADKDNTYEWYDLSEVAVGGVVYRIAADGNITAFQRLAAGDNDLWVKIRARGASRRDYGETRAKVLAHDFRGCVSNLLAPRPLAFDVAALLARRPTSSTPRR